MEHTNIPWRIDKDVRGGLRIYSLPENIRIASVHNAIANVSKAEANALFIVKAVNCHDELLEACKRGCSTLAIAIKSAWKDSTDEEVQEHHVIKQMNAAIAKAEGKS